MHKKLCYKNQKWFDFSEQVKKRDGYKCLKCSRSNDETSLQVHHTIYKQNLESWQYNLSDCITLCKGCHAEHHKIIEPQFGWSLIEINDLEEQDGICERQNCGHSIRYEHLVYHPEVGYKIVGSSCVELLTREDKYISEAVIKFLSAISNFLSNYELSSDSTNNGKPYFFYKYKNHEVRFYKNDNGFSYQINIKEIGKKWYNFGKFVPLKKIPFIKVVELSFIALLGTISEDESQKQILRTIYKNSL
jgi:hypothetical protein